MQGMHILHQWCIKAVQLTTAHMLLLEFVEEFETLYYC
jgi:hypothetical protein